jgi:hypothetical protein
MSTKSVSALLVDDEVRSDYIQGVIKTAQPLGLDIRGVEPNDVVSAVSKYGPDVLIIDAKMKTSPRRLARNAIRCKPELAIFFWTGFTGDADFDDLATSLNPLIRCDVGVKALRADTSREILEESLVAPVQALVERSVARDVWPLRDSVKGESRVFHMSVDDFNGETVADARELIDEAQREIGGLIHYIFENSEAEWLLVAGPDVDIIRWGATLANMPDSRRIMELGHRFRYIPLMFTRPMEVDDIDYYPGSRGWAECPPGDFYPCLGIDFTGDSTSTQQIHFDTGAVKTFLSLDRLQEAGVVGQILPIDIRPGERGTQKFQYIDREVRMLLSDGGEASSLNVRAIVVFDWGQGPFARPCRHGNCPGTRQEGPPDKWICGRREVGLLGRDVLTEGRLRVVLDGAERKTRFLRREDENVKRRQRPWRDG